MDKKMTENSSNEKRINSCLFELNLWKKVKISDPESGNMVFDNAEFLEDVLFPRIKVSGINEQNGAFEEYELPCYTIISDISASDWREDYEQTGNSPAVRNPQEVMTYVRTRIINLQSELQSLGCDSDNLKTEDDMRRILKAVSSTQDLVDAYVESYYKYKFYEDSEYDHEEGAKEYEDACALTDRWSDLMDDLESKVLKAALDEGLLSANSADQGMIKQLEAFMDKYGYRNTGGWWVKKDI